MPEPKRIVLASVIIGTTITDVVGFAVYLGQDQETEKPIPAIA